MATDKQQQLQDFANRVGRMSLPELMALMMSYRSGRDRSKTRKGATHVVNPPGTKLARQAKAYLLTKTDRRDGKSPLG